MGILNLRISDKVMVLFTIISNERGRDRMLFQPSLYFDTEDLVRKTVISVLLQATMNLPWAEEEGKTEGTC